MRGKSVKKGNHSPFGGMAETLPSFKRGRRGATDRELEQQLKANHKGRHKGERGKGKKTKGVYLRPRAD